MFSASLFSFELSNPEGRSSFLFYPSRWESQGNPSLKQLVMPCSHLEPGMKMAAAQPLRPLLQPRIPCPRSGLTHN